MHRRGLVESSAFGPACSGGCSGVGSRLGHQQEHATLEGERPILIHSTDHNR